MPEATTEGRRCWLKPLQLSPSLQKLLNAPIKSRQTIHSTITFQQNQITISINCLHSKAVAMDLRLLGLDSPLFHNLYHHALDDDNSGDKSAHAPSKTYVRDARAMAATPADVKEYPKSYAFVVDMPGLKSGDIKVQVEEDNVLVVCGERKREEEKEEAKYVRMERRIGKFMRKFQLPENANLEKIAAVCQDGVLTVTVEKLPPPEPKKPKTIEVKIA